MTLYHDGHKPWRPQQRRPQTITVPKWVNDGHMEDYDSHKHWFLADRTNGLPYAALLRPSAWRRSVVYLSVVCNVCIVATVRPRAKVTIDSAYRKSYMRNRLVPKWMTLHFVWGCLRSRRPMPDICHWIWRKTLEIDGWFLDITNGHVTDNVAWSQNVKLVTTIRLEPNISDGLFSTPLPCLTARSWEPVRISGWNLRGKN